MRANAYSLVLLGGSLVDRTSADSSCQQGVLPPYGELPKELQEVEKYEHCEEGSKHYVYPLVVTWASGLLRREQAVCVHYDYY